MKKNLLILSILMFSLFVGGCSLNLRVGDKEYSLDKDTKETVEVEQSDIEEFEGKNFRETVDDIKAIKEKAEKERQEADDKKEEASKGAEMFNKLDIAKSSVLGVDIDSAIVDSLASQNIQLRANVVETSYGGNYLYLMGINISNVDTCIKVTANIINDGVVIDNVDRYISMEAGCYNISTIYIDSDFTDIEVSAIVDDYCADMTGKDIDIDYNIGTDGEFSGYLTNNTDIAINFPKVAVVFLDDNKNIINFGETYADTDVLRPGEVINFNGYLNEKIEQYTEFYIYTYGEVYEP